MAVNLNKLKWLVTGALFALCVGPTFISYTPYIFRWDDADYLERAVAVSRAFWSGNAHGLGAAMVSIRPPAMTLLGIPWGPIQTWDAAGKCFITLAAAVSLLAALCLYLLLRVGMKPALLLTASACVFASLGPFQRGGTVRYVAPGFMADSLFAWTCLAAVLLIPYEARMHCPSIRGSVVRGVLRGTILSLGAMTKLSFLFFVLAVLPTVFFLRIHYAGLRRALTALLAFACWSAPSAIYLIRWGKQAFDNAHASSFGSLAKFYYQTLGEYVRVSIKDSPGLLVSFVLIALALMYLLARKRINLFDPDVLPLPIIAGFATVVLLSGNREIRFEYPAIVALPFLTGILISGKVPPLSRSSAALAAALAFCGLVVAGVPTRHRADKQSISRCDAVLADAARCNSRRILLATDSPTFNKNLMDLASEFWPTGTQIEVDTLAYQAISGVPIEGDFSSIRESDEVVFQDEDDRGRPYTNQRAPEYERYVVQHGYNPTRVGGDLTVYAVRRRP